MTFIIDLISKITNFRVKVGDKLNTLKSQIGQINSLTTNDKTSLVGAVNEVNNIQIGGRNYVLNSQTPTFNTLYGSQITNTIVGYNSRKVTYVKSVGGSHNIKAILDVNIPKEGEFVSISFKVKTLSKPVRIDSTQGGRSITIEANTEQYVKWEGIVSNGIKVLRLQLITSKVEETLDLYIWDLKHEVGNKATDWTPAIEDQVSDWAETDSNSLSFIKGKEIINNQLLNLVPYTGANKAVDLNTQRLLTNGVISTTNGTNVINLVSKMVASNQSTNSIVFEIKGTGGSRLMGTYSFELFRYIGISYKFNITSYIYNNNWYLPRITWVSGNSSDISSFNLIKKSDSEFYIEIIFTSSFNYMTAKVDWLGNQSALNGEFNLYRSSEVDLSASTISATILPSQFTRDSYLWDKGNFKPEQYVLQTSLNTQLANYVPINGVTTINNIKTFTSSPIVPNATLNSHAVNLGQLNSLLPTVNDGKLTLTTGTGLNGSTNFTANQSSNSIFDVSVASTHKLPTTAEWASALVNTTYSAGNGLTLSGTTFSLPITVSGSGNYVSDVTQTTNGITVTKSTLPDLTGFVSKNGDNVTPNSKWDNYSKGIYGYLDTDYWRIQGNLVSPNNVELELSTADDATEAIVVRQYYGEFTSKAREAYLLDANGNTSFPEFVRSTKGFVTEYYDEFIIGQRYDQNIKFTEEQTLLNGFVNFSGEVAVTNRIAVGSLVSSTTITAGGNIEAAGVYASGNISAGGSLDVTGAISTDDFVRCSGFSSEGDATVTGVVTANAFYESSLRKYKKNIKEYSNSALDIVKSLDVVTYDRTDSDISNKIGIIADDSHEDVLNEEKTAVDLYKTIFVLTKAVQELQEEIKQLKQQVEAE